MHVLWIGMMLTALLFGAIHGRLTEVSTMVTSSAQEAFSILFGLGGILCFWLGLMRIAEHAGLIARLSNLLRPVMTRLFRDVPADHPAMGSMILNIAANMLGLNHAATPFGLRAMEELEKINPRPGTASNAMCLFLAINTSSVQIIPATAIAILARSGADHPTNIILPTLLATTCSTVAAILAAKYFERSRWFKRKDLP